MDLDYGSSIVEPAHSQELEEKLEKESLLAKAVCADMLQHEKSPVMC